MPETKAKTAKRIISRMKELFEQANAIVAEFESKTAHLNEDDADIIWFSDYAKKYRAIMDQYISLKTELKGV